MVKILGSLPSKYNPFKTAWNSVPEVEQTLEQINWEIHQRRKPNCSGWRLYQLERIIRNSEKLEATIIVNKWDTFHIGWKKTLTAIRKIYTHNFFESPNTSCFMWPSIFEVMEKLS